MLSLRKVIIIVATCVVAAPHRLHAQFFSVDDPVHDAAVPRYPGTSTCAAKYLDLEKVSWSVADAGNGPVTLCASLSSFDAASPAAARVSFAIAGTSTVGSGNRVAAVGGGTRDTVIEELQVDPDVSALFVVTVDVKGGSAEVKYPGAPATFTGTRSGADATATFGLKNKASRRVAAAAKSAGMATSMGVSGVHDDVRINALLSLETTVTLGGPEGDVCVTTAGAVPGLAAAMATSGATDGSSVRVAAATGCSSDPRPSTDNAWIPTAFDTLDVGGVSTARTVASFCLPFFARPLASDLDSRRAILFFAAAPGDPTSERYARATAEARVVPKGWNATEADDSEARAGSWCATCAWRWAPRRRYGVVRSAPASGNILVNVTVGLVNSAFGGSGEAGGGDAASVDIIVEAIGCNVARVVVHPTAASGSALWRVPEIPFTGGDAFQDLANKKDDAYGGTCAGGDVHVEVHNEPAVGIVVTRAGQTLLDTRPPQGASGVASWRDLVVRDGYLEFTTAVPEDAILSGLGERANSFVLSRDWAMHTMWNRDHPAFGGIGGNENLYGTHPLLLVRPRQLQPGAGDGGDTERRAPYGLFLASSAGLDVLLGPDRAQFRATSGIVDLFVMHSRAADSQSRSDSVWAPSTAMDSLLSTYHAIIGVPHLPPLWSLGWHTCRWGIETIQDLAAVPDGYKNARIPVDVVWSDIDYMDRFRMFTTDPQRYPAGAVKEFADRLHADGQRYVVIVDPGVRIVNATDAYEPYHRGVRDNVFAPGIGKVWPGLVRFPDWFAAGTEAYWREELSAFADSIGVDGIWTDMNEVASFQPGHCVLDPNEPTDWDDWFHVPCTKQLEDPGANLPRYWPGGRAPDESTTDLNAMHGNGFTSRDVHSLFGLMEARRTFEALRARRADERPFVLTRSTFPGSGRFATHWLGDNAATWDDMAVSIPGVLAMNTFGIPLVGADACGFHGETTDELCARWIQLATLTPFARTHDEIDTSPQEPYRLSPTVQKVARASIARRYALAATMYSELRRVARSGGAAWRAPVDVFPPYYEALHARDLTSFGDFAVESEFFIGGDILCSPVIKPDVTEKDVYFPSLNSWHWLDKGTVFEGSGKPNIVPAPLDGPSPVFVRAGTALFSFHPHFLATSDAQPQTLADVVKAPLAAVIFPSRTQYGGKSAAPSDDSVSSTNISRTLDLDDGNAPDALEKYVTFEVVASVGESTADSVPWTISVERTEVNGADAGALPGKGEFRYIVFYLAGKDGELCARDATLTVSSTEQYLVAAAHAEGAAPGTISIDLWASSGDTVADAIDADRRSAVERVLSSGSKIHVSWGGCKGDEQMDNGTNHSKATAVAIGVSAGLVLVAGASFFMWRRRVSNAGHDDKGFATLDGGNP